MKPTVAAIFKQNITKEQSKDTGMAMVLLLLLGAVISGRNGLVSAAIAVLVVDMTIPTVYRPIAVLWFGLSQLLGTVVSKIVLTLVFFALVLPIGVLRRLMGKDSLQLRAFKASPESIMTVRNHTFTGKDLEKPY